ncbi:hypothetical protein ACRE_059110 [Hapsidospora chrysogenum ATCC 11550]|uniref:Uncharacterized protein n=1 Tax=Hapsidospora chrysogenum (strain ATCC 11550 / CBS 779.69 / DSM 880 / IAM 14645 / JCM 23072 / IMI 49137) TaxID=857340 RepID=A0A086T1Y1_HAPC1|nr:hypothetical protein ACRE_059110 [Hapsidospora chrysogenum ATCC 11550]
MSEEFKRFKLIDKVMDAVYPEHGKLLYPVLYGSQVVHRRVLRRLTQPMPVVDFARLLFSIMPTPEGQNDEVFDRLIASLNFPWDKSKAMPLGCLSVRQGRQHPTPPAGTAPTTASNEPPEDVMAQRGGRFGHYCTAGAR